MSRNFLPSLKLSKQEFKNANEEIKNWSINQNRDKLKGRNEVKHEKLDTMFKEYLEKHGATQTELEKATNIIKEIEDESTFLDSQDKNDVNIKARYEFLEKRVNEFKELYGEDLLQRCKEMEEDKQKLLESFFAIANERFEEEKLSPEARSILNSCIADFILGEEPKRKPFNYVGVFLLTLILAIIIKCIF